jgi:nucleotide-binding universal stress UspA family protein
MDDHAHRRRITVGYAGESSRPAIDWATREAERRKASLLLVDCFTPTLADAGVPTFEAVAHSIDEQSRTEDELRRVAAEVQRQHAGLEIDVCSCAGPPATGLAAAARGSSLVVIGSHGRKANTLWRGRTARPLIRMGPCPVVVVRDATEPKPVVRVVVGTDGSATSMHAVAWAAAESALLHVPLVIVHAAGHQATPYGRSTAASETILARAVAHAREHGATDVLSEVLHGPPGQVIVDIARPNDLIVIGRSGVNVAVARIFGSTASEVLERCPVTAVVVPGPSCDSGSDDD